MALEYMSFKENLVNAIASASENLGNSTALYAVLETEDPMEPFALRLVHMPGDAGPFNTINERLFNKAFLDFGYLEVRSEDNLEGVLYKPVEDMFADPDCIGVAPVSRFDEDVATAYMAHGADEDAQEDPDSLRFASFLRLVRQRVLTGGVSEKLDYEGLLHICGLLFKYESNVEGHLQTVLAFQRVQPMWVQKKSQLLLFNEDGGQEMFADTSLKIGTTFDFCLFDDQIAFRTLKSLEILFKYRLLVAQQAKDYADTLDGILADFEKIDERIEANRATANRLLKIQKEKSPVADMSAEELEYRVNRVGFYSRRIKFNEEGKVMLTTNADVKDFLTMLDDNLLVSPLSEARYESKSKKRLDQNE